MKEFSHSINLFRFAPVLNCDDELVPLNSEFDDNEWGDVIGFNANPNDLLPVGKELHGKEKQFNEYSFTALDGSELKEHASPKCSDSHEDSNKDTPMPLLSTVYFKAVPIRYCAPLVLQNFVASHLGCEDSKDRDGLMQIATSHVN